MARQISKVETRPWLEQQKMAQQNRWTDFKVWKTNMSQLKRVLKEDWRDKRSSSKKFWNKNRRNNKKILENNQRN